MPGKELCSNGAVIFVRNPSECTASVTRDVPMGRIMDLF